jgi:hypothetical protein
MFEEESPMVIGFFCLACAAAVVMLGAGIYAFVSAHEVSDTVYITTLSDKMSIKGVFALGSGYIRGEPVFVSYVITGDNSYALKTFDADKSTIYMDSQDPYVVRYKMESADIVKELRIKDYHKFDIHVPVGTIVEKINLDGEL